MQRENILSKNSQDILRKQIGKKFTAQKRKPNIPQCVPAAPTNPNIDTLFEQFYLIAQFLITILPKVHNEKNAYDNSFAKLVAHLAAGCCQSIRASFFTLVSN